MAFTIHKVNLDDNCKETNPPNLGKTKRVRNWISLRDYTARATEIQFKSVSNFQDAVANTLVVCFTQILYTRHWSMLSLLWRLGDRISGSVFNWPWHVFKINRTRRGCYHVPRKFVDIAGKWTVYSNTSLTYLIRLLQILWSSSFLRFSQYLCEESLV